MDSRRVSPDERNAGLVRRSWLARASTKLPVSRAAAAKRGHAPAAPSAARRLDLKEGNPASCGGSHVVSPDMSDLTATAAETAERQLAVELPRRWAHVQGVAARAVDVAGAADESDRDLLVAAAYLHDIGYAPELAGTGFHPLDGARFLRDQGAPDRLARLVAHHTCSRLEAELRGLADELNAEFPCENSATADALWYCDLTTGPDGERLSVPDRLAEIETRYGPDDLVTEFIGKARPELLAVAARVEARLSALAQST